MTGWRVMVVQDNDTFLHDRIKLFMAYKDDKGLSAVVPLILEMAEPIPDGMTNKAVEPTVIPRELAEKIYEQLGFVLTGVSEPFNEIRRLRAELKEARKMLDNLINGIGSLGGGHGNRASGR